MTHDSAPSRPRWAVNFKGKQLETFDNWNDGWLYRMAVLRENLHEIMTADWCPPPELVRIDLRAVSHTPREGSGGE